MTEKGALGDMPEELTRASGLLRHIGDSRDKQKLAERRGIAFVQQAFLSYAVLKGSLAQAFHPLLFIEKSDGLQKSALAQILQPLTDYDKSDGMDKLACAETLHPPPACR